MTTICVFRDQIDFYPCLFSNYILKKLFLKAIKNSFKYKSIYI